MIFRAKHFAELVKARLEELDAKPFSIEQAYGLPPDAIRNVLRSSVKNGPRLDRVEEICDALGLELYIGPGRDRSNSPDRRDWRGFAEEQLQIEGRSEALALGYEPILYDAEAGGIDNLSPFALSRDWVAEQGLNMPDLRCMRVLKGQGGGFFAEGDIIVVDTGVDGSYGGDVCAFYPSVMSGLQIGRLATIKKIRIAAFNSERGLQQVELKPGSKVVGRVVYGFSKVDHDA